MNLQTLYTNMLNQLTSSEGEWEKFLNFSSQIHKYPFDQAVLIYAQNPNVTMLATQNIWSKINRGIATGSKAIMVTKYEQGQQNIDYLFDVTQTTGGYLKKPVWSIQDYEKEFIFNGIIDEAADTLEGKLDSLVQQKLIRLYWDNEDHCENAFSEYLGKEQGEQLELLYNLAVSSSEHMVRMKCGLVQKEQTDFKFIKHLGDFKKINLLGYLVSESTKYVMSRVADLKKEFNQERVVNDDNIVQREQGRNSISRDSSEQQQPSRSTTGILRGTGDDLPTGKESDSIQRASDERDIDGENASSKSGSKRANSQLDEGIGETESVTNRLPGESKSSETTESTSRGNRIGRVRPTTEINKDLEKEPDSNKEPGSFILSEDGSMQFDLFNDWDSVANSADDVTGNEQDTESISKDERNSSTKIAITQDIIDETLIRGTGTQNGKFRVYEFFNSSPGNRGLADFLKKEYGFWGSSGPETHMVMSNSKGIEISHYKDRDVNKTLSWPKVAKRVAELIHQDRYLNDQEKLDLKAYHLERKLDSGGDTSKSETPISEVEEVAAKSGQVIETQNYRFNESDDLYPNGEKTKYKNNVAAIQLLKELESENKQATVEEQKVLAKYVGWGGLANVFNPDSEKWSKEYNELKELLTDEEYRAAMQSTITAYYTEPAIVEKMYQALQNFGFEKGNILDPAMGTGNFYSVLPGNLSESNLTGVELDSITGRLAKQLYPNANVLVQGYETTKFEDNQFDLVIGNIPFNDIQVSDRRYDKHKFLIHDYFMAKSMDLVKPGGIVAVITSKGTMDKKNPKTREYLAARSELLGAIRLPNNAFKSIAGTEATADILFLQKRENVIDVNGEFRPNWVDVGNIEGTDIEVNNYFLEHPEMILGTMQADGYFDGRIQSTCVPNDEDLITSLDRAINSVNGAFNAKNVLEEVVFKQEEPIELELERELKPFTFVVENDEIYYFENDVLNPQKFNAKDTERIKGLCEIRIAVENVINIQSNENYDSNALKTLQDVLNQKYDEFVTKHGYINNRVNQRAFFEDDQLPLLMSLEDEQKDGTFKKADIFYKATIRPQIAKTHADTAQEALEMSLSRNMQVDLPYMVEIYGKDIETIIKELDDQIYLNPQKYSGDITYGWETSDEYLTGNVRDKLDYARLSATKEPGLFTKNVQALEDAQPIPLLPGDISFKIGAPWVPKEYYQEFMYDLFDTSRFHQTIINLEYIAVTNTWKIRGKNQDYGVKNRTVYGTKRINGYQIFEDCLNLQDATVKDPEKYYDRNGDEKTKYVVNVKETMIARSKQQEIQEAFQSWLFKDPDRSRHLLKIYNERFNSIRPRTYDGNHLAFPGMSEDMELRKHQKDVVARMVSTGRGLLAHEVGAGKTAAMIAGAMKLKQSGLMKKPMFVVMNHTIDQWAKEILRFYPSAKVLIATKKDFEKKNRQRFVSKIATGDYDAIVIGHSQFEKIPISKERRKEKLQNEIDTLSREIREAKKAEGNDWSVKQLVIFQKSLETKLEKLGNEHSKDNVINFEDLGVDGLLVDEAHVFKNLFTVTKIRNVAGIGTSSSQRAIDMKLKCEYIQEKNDGRGVIFATGTPVTNSMSELFVMQRFLQPDVLKRAGLEFFDNWAGTFGEVVSSLEMNPEGSGYRMKSRFAKFHNLPELMSMFNMVADIQTADMLKLPVPDLEGGKAQIVVSECSDFQKMMMDEFVERSEAIRNGNIDPSVDNMLKLTHEAKLMAIDPRLIDEDAPVSEDSKLNMCIENVHRIWEETKENKSTQMIFSDSGTPKANKFNVYDEIKNQLIDKGIPEEEIAFIHDAKTDVQRDKLFTKVRNGDVRVLLGSTSKVGTGTNVQDRLIAGHHIDCPWRPADLTQRDGRIVRQGNMNEKVAIYRYVTRGTFDGYLWQIQEQKLRYISQVMTGKNISRSCDDTDETVLTAAEVKAIATDNPLLLEKMTLDNEVNRLKLVHNRWSNEKASMEINLNTTYPNRIAKLEQKIRDIQHDLSIVSEHAGDFKIELDGMTFFDEKNAGEALKAISKSNLDEKPIVIGKYRGLDVYVRRSSFNEPYVGLKGQSQYDVLIKARDQENIHRLTKIVDNYGEEMKEIKADIDQVNSQIETVKLELKKPFPYEDELKTLLKKQADLNLKMEFSKDLEKQDDAEEKVKPKKRSMGMGM